MISARPEHYCLLYGWRPMSSISPNQSQPQYQNDGMAQHPRLDLRPGVSEPVVLLISRREVESGDIASVLSRLKPFLATREEAWRYRGQMTLVVDGYNNDPRELVDIPEVRTLRVGWKPRGPTGPTSSTRSTTASSCCSPASPGAGSWVGARSRWTLTWWLPPWGAPLAA